MAVGSSSAFVDAIELDVEAEAAHFLDEHVEALRDAGLERVVALDDRLVDLGAADHVVRLHRQHFLQRVGGAVGLERPDLHFAEALAAELRLAAQRLLGDEAVRPDRTRVDLVVDQVVQLEHVDVAHRHLAVERSPVRPSNRSPGPTCRDPAFSSIADTSASRAPSNTGVPIGTPSVEVLGQLDDLVVARASISWRSCSP